MEGRSGERGEGVSGQGGGGLERKTVVVTVVMREQWVLMRVRVWDRCWEGEKRRWDEGEEEVAPPPKSSLILSQALSPSRDGKPNLTRTPVLSLSLSLGIGQRRSEDGRGCEVGEVASARSMECFSWGWAHSRG